jgi:hypothetical protein
VNGSPRLRHDGDRAEVAVFWTAAVRMLDYAIAAATAGHHDDEVELLTHAARLLAEVPRRLDACGVPRRVGAKVLLPRRHLTVVK